MSPGKKKPPERIAALQVVLRMLLEKSENLTKSCTFGIDPIVAFVLSRPQKWEEFKSLVVGHLAKRHIRRGALVGLPPSGKLILRLSGVHVEFTKEEKPEKVAG